MGRKFAEIYLTLAIFFNPLTMLALSPIYVKWICKLGIAGQLTVVVIYGIIVLAAIPVFFCVPESKKDYKGRKSG